MIVQIYPVQDDMQCKRLERGEDETTNRSIYLHGPSLVNHQQHLFQPPDMYSNVTR